MKQTQMLTEIKKSKFYAFCLHDCSVQQFEQALHAIRKEHKKANHILFAYTILQDGLKEKYTDDKEPKGCGIAMLSLLQKANVKNCAVIVVRYFGGIKLGAGGLIRAYVASCKDLVKV